MVPQLVAERYTPPAARPCPELSVLGRVVALLEALGATDDITVADLVRRVGLPKTTVHRIVADLVRYGLIERTGGTVSLGIHLFELGCRVPAYHRLRQLTLPFPVELYEATQGILHLGVLDARDVVYRAGIPSRTRAP